MGILSLVIKKQKKELVLYVSTLLLAFVISLLLSLGVKVPSPLITIEKIILTIIGE